MLTIEILVSAGHHINLKILHHAAPTKKVTPLLLKALKPQRANSIIQPPAPEVLLNPD